MWLVHIRTVTGELIYSKNEKSAFKASSGVFTGTIFGIMLKICITGMVTFYFLKAVIARQSFFTKSIGAARFLSRQRKIRQNN